MVDATLLEKFGSLRDRTKATWRSLHDFFAPEAPSKPTSEELRWTSQYDIYLGRHFDRRTQDVGDELRYGDERHLLVFGPNGSGKSTRFLVPNLLTLTGRSIIVIDPKGELAAITARHRHELGDKIRILDPFGVLKRLYDARPEKLGPLFQLGLIESAGFNPMDALDPDSPTFYDDAAAIGEALIKIETKDPHWSESAQGLVVGLIMWEKKTRKDKASLEHVRHMLTEPDEFVKEIGPDGKEHTRLVRGLRITASAMVAAGGYEIASLAARFTRESKEMDSIRSTADTQTRWLLSRLVREDLARGAIDFKKLKEEPTTVYVILPAERLRTHANWLRLVVVSALRSLYREGGLRTLMFIDEFAALGHLPPLEDAFGLVRAYRVQIAAILQDLAQLKALYADRWETFVANAGVVFGFAPNDKTTAEWMSWRSGQTTVVVKGFSENRNQTSGLKGAGGGGDSISDQQTGRPLFLPNELLGFEKGTGLVWLAGMANPVSFFGPDWWKIGKCRERGTDSPYYD